eukprot:gene2586-3339_t
MAASAQRVVIEMADTWPHSFQAIYVYSLPPNFTTHLLPPSSYRRQSAVGLSAALLMDRLLSSTHRTSDPTQADFFYVGLSTGSFLGPKGVAEAIKYIQTKYPFWQRKRGADHIFMVADDMGSCGGDGTLALLTNKSIRLTYFGYHGPNLGHNEERCFHPGKDIVIPDFEATPDFARESWEKQQTATNVSPMRNITLQFAGEIIDADVNESDVGTITKQLNVRRLVYRLHGHVPGFEIATPSQRKVNFYRMQQAVFCLAPAGVTGLWGQRVTMALLLGCIPVIIQDNYEQPFEEYLPYGRFAVRVKEEDVPHLPSILANISGEAQQSMQREVACVASRFYWGSVFGPFRDDLESKEDAFATL